MLLKNFVAAYQSLRKACAILGFLSSGQLWRHILVAQRILSRATQNSVFFANIVHPVLADMLLKNFVAVADVLLKNFVAAAVFSVSYFSRLLKNLVAAYQSLKEACAISGPCTSTRTWSVFHCSPFLSQLTRCGRIQNEPSAVEKTS